jgi:E3 ubiquitin-protein ligase SHPRH
VNGDMEENITDQHFTIFDPKELYESIKPSKEIEAISQPSELLVPLRQYQLKAASWMLQRENKVMDASDRIHPLWTELTGLWVKFRWKFWLNDSDGNRFYFNAINGDITLNRFTEPNDIAGGILAEGRYWINEFSLNFLSEMGLGKTLEVIACILSNRKSDVEASTDVDMQDDEDVVNCTCGRTDNVNDSSNSVFMMNFIIITKRI